MPRSQAPLPPSTMSEIERLRDELARATTQRDAAIWALRIVRRDIHWYDDSPTLRVVEQVLDKCSIALPVQSLHRLAAVTD
jgi:hypothetical protein